MDRKEYQEYQSLLESTKIPEYASDEQVMELIRPLMEEVKQIIPEHLYRYRSFNENNIEAFRNNEVYMSTQDNYNDPFDTLIQYDEKKLLEAFDLIQNPKVFNQITQQVSNGTEMPFPINSIFGTDEKNAFKNLANQMLSKNFTPFFDSEKIKHERILLKGFIKELPTTLQRLATTACFSENYNSILMWSHYADYHKGFVLGYDIRPFLYDSTIKIFPVVYSNKRYDANEFIYFLTSQNFGLKSYNPDILSHYKLLLYKAKEWSYENEWRLIDCATKHGISEPFFEPHIIKPNSIYYGCKTPDKYIDELHKIAKKKGLKEYRMQIKNSSGEYQMECFEAK